MNMLNYIMFQVMLIAEVAYLTPSIGQIAELDLLIGKTHKHLIKFGLQNLLQRYSAQWQSSDKMN